MLDGTKRSIGYDAYLRTEAWTRKRDIAIERAGRRCQVCNAPNDLEVHHRTYERVTHEADGDLTVLCARCHRFFHEIVGAVTGTRVMRPATKSDVEQAATRWKRRGARANRSERKEGQRRAIERIRASRPQGD